MLNIFFLQAQPQGGGIGQMLIMVVGFIAFMYFMVMRPQMKKQKQEKTFQESLKVGRRVVTTSGLHGRIAQILDDGVIIETLSGKLKFEKSAISRDYTQGRFPENENTKNNSTEEEKK